MNSYLGMAVVESMSSTCRAAKDDILDMGYRHKMAGGSTRRREVWSNDLLTHFLTSLDLVV